MRSVFFRKKQKQQRRRYPPRRTGWGGESIAFKRGKEVCVQTKLFLG